MSSGFKTTETVMRNRPNSASHQRGREPLCRIRRFGGGQKRRDHVLSFRLPGGQIERFRYIGDVPPTVIRGPEVMASSLDPADPFATLDRIATEMDRQAEALWQDGAPGAEGSGVIPALSGPGVCMRSVPVTYRATTSRRVSCRGARATVARSTETQCPPRYPTPPRRNRVPASFR
ncbi:MAG: hypothetical protein QOF70_1123 [Acetobacteraceae bacterium]|nr:hypothetical protein [Acetobacteraceae bacterium]